MQLALDLPSSTFNQECTPNCLCASSVLLSFSPGLDRNLLEVLGQSQVDSTDLARESHALPHDTSTCIAG